jgi:hypothetical protein
MALARGNTFACLAISSQSAKNIALRFNGKKNQDAF